MTESKSDNQKTAPEIPPILKHARIVLREWRRVLLGGLCGFLIGLALVHILPTKYTSETVVRPPDQGSLSGVAGLASSLGKGLLGSVGGGDLFSGADQSNFDEFSNLLDSNELSHWLATNHPDILQHIFKDKWDSDAHRWKTGGVLRSVIDGVRVFLGMAPSHAPAEGDLRRYLSKTVDTSTDFKTGMITIRYSDEDPEFARQLVTWMHEGADQIVRNKERERSQKRIAYLNKLLPNVTQTDLHLIMATLLAQEEQKMMTIQADRFYAAWPVDSAVAAQRPSFPPVLLMLVSFTLLGIASAAAWLIYFPGLHLKEKRVLKPNMTQHSIEVS